MDLIAIQISEQLNDLTFLKLLSLVDVEKQDKIQRFYRWQDAHNSLISELLIRYEIIRKTKLENSEIQFDISSFGKPFLVNDPTFQFNVSHSGNWVVVAFHSEQIGVDIEKIDSIDLTISEHFFCANEHKDIVANHSPNIRFFDYWTLKESYIKFIGKGLSYPLNKFEMVFDTDNTIGIKNESQVLDRIYFKQYTIDENYKLAVCLSEMNFTDNVTVIQLTDFIATLETVLQ